MQTVVKGVGGLEHRQWRAYADEYCFQGVFCLERNQSFPAHGSVDGDLVNQFLHLDEEAMQQVVAGMSRPSTVDNVTRLVEDLGRAIFQVCGLG